MGPELRRDGVVAINTVHARGGGIARHARVDRELFCKMFRGLPRRGPQSDYHGQEI